MRAIPFEHREFRRVQRSALAVAEDAGKIEDARLARRQQLFGRELGRSVQIKVSALAAGLNRFGREGVQMRLVTRRDRQRAAFDFGEALRLEIGRVRSLDPVALAISAGGRLDVCGPPGSRFSSANYAVHRAIQRAELSSRLGKR